MKRALFLGLAIVMLLACAACKTTAPSENPSASPNASQSPSSSPSSDPAEEGKEPVTLQVFSMPSNISGLQENKYWTEILERDVNVKLEMLPAGDQSEDKLAALMASKQLPDIVVFKDYKQVTDAIEAGLIINIDDYKDQLPNVYANAGTAVEYMRDNISMGTGACYAIPNNVSTTPNTIGVANYGPYLRWDLYKQLGMPELAEVEDYLPLLKDMLALEPTNAEGQKNYGISIWKDWDGSHMAVATHLQNLYGVENIGEKAYTEVNYATGEMKYIFDDDSMYKRALKWYFTANQMGILDPDSLTHGWGDYWDKASAGRVMFSIWSWGFGTYATEEKSNAGNGYMPVYFTNEKQKTDGPQYVGGTWCYAISSATEHLDEALAFVDYMYSYDGLWTLAYGDAGTYWDIDESGEPYITELGWQMRADNLEFPNGGHIGDGLNEINAFGMPWSFIHPTYNHRLDNPGESDWPKKDYAPAETALTLDWRETMGAQDDMGYLTAHGLNIDKPFAPLSPTPDNIQAILDRVADIVKNDSWLCVFASNEAEFESLFAEMRSKAIAVNVEETDNWFIQEYQSALASGSKYMK